MAGSIRFFLDYDYSLVNTESHDNLGRKIQDQETRSFSQSYRLNIEQRLFPRLTLRGGGFFEQSTSEVTDSMSDTEITGKTISPFLDLFLDGGIYKAGTGYNRVEQDAGADRTIRERYYLTYSWRPAGLPPLSLSFNRSNFFDEERRTQDSTITSWQWSSEYQLLKNLEVGYQGNWSLVENRLSGNRSETTRNVGRANFSDSFLDGRANLNVDYTFSLQESRSSFSGTGETILPVLAIPPGLSALDDTPEEGELTANPALTDNETGPSAGIDLGLAFGGAATLRNMGLELLNPESETDVFFVYVDRTLTETVANSFTWLVYSSEDNLNWSLRQSVKGSFDLFQNRFEIRFSPLKARFIKVVTPPLGPGVVGGLDFPDILVTEIAAGKVEPATEVKREISTVSHVLNSSALVRLLEKPALDYNFAFFFTRSGQPAFSRWTFSNSLTTRHRFNPILTGTGYVSRDDRGTSVGDRQEGYRYGFGLNATPLPALRHSLVGSGQWEKTETGWNKVHSLSLSNRANVYRGASLFVNGGLSKGLLGSGRDSQSYFVSIGTDLVPNPILKFSLSHSSDRSEQTGAGQPALVSTSSRSRITAAYNPRPALNLSGNVDFVESGGESFTLTSWGANWAPFSGGALQISLGYNESLRSVLNTIDRLALASVRWEIRSGVFLESSYSSGNSESDTGESSFRVLNAGVSAVF